MYCVFVVNQCLIPILKSNIPSNHSYFVGFKSYFCNVKMRLGNTVIDCQKKEISCFLCLEDLVSEVELILERDEYSGGDEDNWDGADKKRDFYIELRFAHDPNQYDKPVLFDEQGFVPYCNIYDVTANNNDKNVIAHVSRYAGIVNVRMSGVENRTVNT